VGEKGRAGSPVPELAMGHDVLDEPVGSCAPCEVQEDVQDARRDRHTPVFEKEEMSPGIGGMRSREDNVGSA